jgi:ATP-dependent helicase HrpB
LGNGRKPYPLRYEAKSVTLAAPLQDLYDLANHPSIGGGDFLVAIEILAPNGRVVQVTKDLPAFWEGSYQKVKKDLAGRYPKHEWR